MMKQRDVAPKPMLSVVVGRFFSRLWPARVQFILVNENGEALGNRAEYYHLIPLEWCRYYIHQTLQHLRLLLRYIGTYDQQKNARLVHTSIRHSSHPPRQNQLTICHSWRIPQCPHHIDGLSWIRLANRLVKPIAKFIWTTKFCVHGNRLFRSSFMGHYLIYIGQCTKRSHLLLFIKPKTRILQVKK